MALGVINIQVLDYDVRFQARFSLCVDKFLHYLFEVDGFLLLLFYLKLNRRLEVFLEIADHSKLIEGYNKIKLYLNGLKMLEVECPVLSLF